MSVKKNKKTVSRFLEKVWNEGVLEVEDELVSKDYVYHDPAAPDLHGPEAHKQFVMLYRSALPDLHFTVEDLFGKGDKVVMRWTTTGTHKGELMGIPATGIETQGFGTSITRFDEEGKIVEEWTNWSALGFFQQLGVIPPLGGE